MKRPEHTVRRCSKSPLGNRAGILRSAGLTALAVLVGFFAPGCDGVDGDGCCGPDVWAPAAPQGVWSETGDMRVTLSWLPNTERDLHGYRVYRSEAPRGYFGRIASLGYDRTSFVDHDVANGVTYFYALAAFDDDANESPLSVEEVHDTPRPDGDGLELRNALESPGRAGLDFSRRAVVDYRDLEADLYFWHNESEGPWMIATEHSDEQFTDIQDAGYGPLDKVSWAPENGWAPSGEVPLVSGHNYVVWTWDNHFAKFQVVRVDAHELEIDWAYQVDRGNPELRVENARYHRTNAPRREHKVGMARR